MVINLNHIDLYYLSIVIFFVSIIVHGLFNAKVKQYSHKKISSGKSGAEIAEQMLHDNGIFDVKIVSREGFLKDYYNPLTKTVNLSADFYNGRNVAAAAVAAHECGHAIQHNKNYIFLHLRSAMVPLYAFSSKFIILFVILGFFMINISLIPLEIGICLYAITTVFTFLTLPVEVDASNRALNWIETNNIVDDKEYKDAKGALKLAAMTYVLAALASLTELLRLISIVNSRREE